MTRTGVDRTDRGRLLVLLLAALAALAALLLPAPPASAATAPAAEKGVGAQPVESIFTVGVAHHISAGQHPVRGPSQLQVASAHCVAAEAGTGAARIPFGPGTEDAWNVLERVTSKGSPLPGYKGGSVFKNLEGRLPELDGAGNPVTYREWDVHPYTKGVDRGPERIVTGSDGSAYYTAITTTPFSSSGAPDDESTAAACPQ